MKKKSVKILLLGLFVILFFTQATQGGIVPVGAKKAGTITVTAVDDLGAGTPIIVNASLLPSGIDLDTAIVVDTDENELPTQYDEGIDELVFVLKTAIAKDEEVAFDLTGESSGTDNGQTVSMKIGQGDYHTTYGSWLPSSQTGTFMNGTTQANMVKAIGDVIWVESDWGVLCLQVEADWRQGTWRHVYLKDEKYDAVGTDKWNASSDWQFQWAASLFQDADEGWQRGSGAPDTIEVKKVGPVRAVIKAIANADYKDLLGQSVKNCNATRTYTIYNNLMGIGQHFTLSGDNATQAMTDFTELNELEEPIRMKHQMMGGRFGEKGATNYTKVFAPGAGEGERGVQVDLSKVTDSYFAVYSNVTKVGFFYNWGSFDYKANLDKLDPGQEVVMNYHFDAFPAEGLNRFYVPIAKAYDADGDTIAEYTAAINDMWTAEYTIKTAGVPAPGFDYLLGIIALLGVSLFIRKQLRRR